MSASTTPAPETIITLNVGGTKYQTTRDTLRNMELVDGAKQPNYFTALLERSPATQTEFFIDRNPRFFAFILDYMRQGCSVDNMTAAFPDCVLSLLTPNEHAHANLRSTLELLDELKYYCLNKLAWQIKTPPRIPLPDNSFLFFFETGRDKQACVASNWFIVDNLFINMKIQFQPADSKMIVEAICDKAGTYVIGQAHSRNGYFFSRTTGKVNRSKFYLGNPSDQVQLPLDLSFKSDTCLLMHVQFQLTAN